MARKQVRKRPFIVRFFGGLIKKTVAFILLMAILLASVVGGLYVANKIFVPTPLDELPYSERESEALLRAQSNVHFLLVGSDEREDEVSRSDTMIYMVVRPKDKKISYLSLPRDTLVSIEGYGEDKLNHSYAYGGLPLLESTIRSNFHTRIDHVVKVNFNSFKKVIDAMGGITIDVESDMSVPWEDIDLKKGKQVLNGHDALGYVRWRSDGLGDLGRIERQQKFMQAVTEKLEHMMPWEVIRVLYTVQSEIETDFSFRDMLVLGSRLVGIGKEDVSHLSLDVEPVMIGGISYVRYNPDNVKAVLDEAYYGMVLGE